MNKLQLLRANSTSRNLLLGGCVLLSTAFGSLSASAETATLLANQDTYISGVAGARDTNYGTANQIQVSGRGTANARKTYLGFDLSAYDTGVHFNNTSSLSLSLSNPPLIGNANGSVTLNVYGITDNTAQFNQNLVTWNNAPKNNGGSSTNFSTAGVTLLGTITIPSGTAQAGNTVILTGSGLADFLNWAVGNSGDYYGTGATQANANKITLLLGTDASYVGTSFPGFNFHSTNATTANGLKPHLTLNYQIPEPSTTAAIAGALTLAATIVWRKRRKHA